MFRRRQKQNLLQHVREFFWPSIGFGRSTRYLMHRIGRMPGTPTSIAVGFACGAAVACTPFVGFHLGIALILAWIVRGSPVAAAIATQVVGNPWTIPLILLGIYNLGAWMLGESSLHRLPPEVHVGYLFHHPFQVLLPMALGAIPVSIAVWLISFFPARFLVSRYHRRRQLRRRGRPFGSRLGGEE
jgi:uncharacterized protein (DUF2062 family)